MSHNERYIQKIRQGYRQNPHWGLACWIDEFDSALLSTTSPAALSSCAALLREVKTGDYQLYEHEAPYIQSREGAFFLHRGVSRRLKNDSFQSHSYYQKSYELFSQLSFREGLGQLVIAQRELYSTEVDRALLTQLLKEASSNRQQSDHADQTPRNTTGI